MATETLPAKQSASSSAAPAPWIDALFDRLAGMYGRHWFDLWAHVPMADVKACWREALAGVSGEQIKRGIEHCQRGGAKFAPTAPEFAGICRTFRVEPAHRLLLSAPRTDMPPHIREKLHAFVSRARGEAA